MMFLKGGTRRVEASSETLKRNEYKTINNGKSGLNEYHYLRRP